MFCGTAFFLLSLLSPHDVWCQFNYLNSHQFATLRCKRAIIFKFFAQQMKKKSMCIRCRAIIYSFSLTRKSTTLDRKATPGMKRLNLNHISLNIRNAILDWRLILRISAIRIDHFKSKRRCIYMGHFSILPKHAYVK